MDGSDSSQAVSKASALRPPSARPEGPFDRARLASCPECGATSLTPVSDGQRVSFFCESCALCWHTELGWVTRVNPNTCPGCPRQPECFGRARPYGSQAPAASA